MAFIRVNSRFVLTLVDNGRIATTHWAFRNLPPDAMTVTQAVDNG